MTKSKFDFPNFSGWRKLKISEAFDWKTDVIVKHQSCTTIGPFTPNKAEISSPPGKSQEHFFIHGMTMDQARNSIPKYDICWAYRKDTGVTMEPTLVFCAPPAKQDIAAPKPSTNGNPIYSKELPLP